MNLLFFFNTASIFSIFMMLLYERKKISVIWFHYHLKPDTKTNGG